ncbi:hypothetical protein C21_02805 [Arenibacter sp. NBRC 103722]|uniref:hypothetical protein n=1 Tax=Arenibacter sp. NBRC 103722 TaxID=1113929 RepID=UPI000853A9C0|nr:hypothetical protein [Arenibacter sp. NBRC 103722]GBF20632.1 hypothetical protein C21_02805 [Arenibacter sp. NBRC 103722]
MRKFEVYRNIRKQAVIFGLSISFFALQMICVVSSLMVIIFSFSLAMIMGVLVFNAALYIALIKITNNPQQITLWGVFPKIISNKKSSLLSYGQD